MGREMSLPRRSGPPPGGFGAIAGSSPLRNARETPRHPPTGLPGVWAEPGGGTRLLGYDFIRCGSATRWQEAEVVTLRPFEKSPMKIRNAFAALVLCLATAPVFAGDEYICKEGCTPGYWKQAQHFG